MRKSVIVFDVDNVLLNFSESFSQWFNDKHVEGFKKLGDNPDDYYFGYKDNDIFRKYIAEFVSKGIDIGPLQDNTSDIIQQLIKTYQIVLLTAYPNLVARKEQLDKYNIPYDKLLYSPADIKHKTIKEMKLNPIAVFEDKPSTVRLLSKAGFQVYVPKRWNYVRNEKWNADNITFYDELSISLVYSIIDEKRHKKFKLRRKN